MAETARQEIEEFLASKEAGMKTQFKKTMITNAATAMFTANGLSCPIMVIERNGETYLINREIVKS